LSQFDQRRAARERDATSSSWWIPLLNVTLFGVAQVLARCHDWMHADQPPNQGLPFLLHRTFRRPFAFPCRLHLENYRSLDAVGLGLISIITGGRSSVYYSLGRRYRYRAARHTRVLARHTAARQSQVRTRKGVLGGGERGE